MSVGLIEMIAFFGIVLAFGIYQLISVNRSLRDDRQRADRIRKDEL
ncbi:MAG: hypothetical protein IKE66_07005 [Hyphomicrobium sp.]|nr:hypothetical protein [Hyphomicrobium sp.]